MQVVEVIPVVKGITKPTLSYFTKERFEPGSFVRIPVKSGSALGIVATSQDARRNKSELKSSSFALRKLSVPGRAGSLSKAFMLAVKDTANFYATSGGNVLSTLLPKILLADPKLIGYNNYEKYETEKEIKLVQLAEDERFREYRGIIRESFARGSSVLFIVPNKDDVIDASKKLSTGIEQYVFTATNYRSKELKKVFVEAKQLKHPILFITTPALVAFDRKDLGTIVLERENSRSYRSMRRPFISIKVFLERYAKTRGATLILGDSLLSLESLWKEREGEYSEFTPLTWRLKERASSEIIDMREHKDFEIFSSRLRNALTMNLAENKKSFVFAARKGLASTTICGDCASFLLCKNCGSPMVLHEPPMYVCHHCGAKRSTETRCDTCQSWKLTPLGIGIEKVVQTLKNLFPETEIFVLDKEHTPTEAQAKRTAEAFKESIGGIMVGTELALPYLAKTIKRIPLVASASLDSLFSIPEFGINERVFYLITRLRELAEDRFILQSRNAKSEILEYAVAGNVLDFYRTEIKEREELSYPPFSIFIKVSVEDTPENIERKAAHLQKLFLDKHPHFMLEKRKDENRHVLNMILRMKQSSWPSKELVERLLLLTPDFTVKVDPESIL